MIWILSVLIGLIIKPFSLGIFLKTDISKVYADRKLIRWKSLLQITESVQEFANFNPRMLRV